jgi:superoxide reductase
VVRGDGEPRPPLALYKDSAEIARVYLHPVFSAPKVTFTIALDEGGTLRALAEPTHSAAWEASKKIAVVR